MKVCVLYNPLIQIIKMKEALRKISGASFSCEIGEVQLVQTFRQDHSEFDQLYFFTQHENIICKVYDLQGQSSMERFKREQEVYKERKYSQLAEALLVDEVQIKKNNFGVILLKIPKKSLLHDIFSNLPYCEWLNLTETVLDLVQKLKNQKQVFLNINPWSIARDDLGEFKVFDVQFLTQEGNYQKISSNNYALIDICESQYHYHSPQLLDEYSKYKIDASSDIFSFGIVLYELLFHQYPFDSKLSQINTHFRSNSNEKSFFLEFIMQALKPYPKRASIDQLRIMLDMERKKVPKGPSNKSLSTGSSSQNKSSNTLFSGLTQMFSKWTTETEGWYLSFTENDNNRPQQKYLNLIVNKLYKKETKLDKLASIIMKYTTNDDLGKDSQIIKTLLLIISLCRRGPINIMNYQWNDVLKAIQNASSKNTAIVELCSFCRQKITINNSVKNVFRGNFYIEEPSTFKNLSIQMVNLLFNHLVWVIDSINLKFLSFKDQKPLMDYLRQIYCDQILDCISMLIFSVICIRKDNQLQLRKDNLNEINQIQKKINNILKKISNLSNHVSAHAIYSLQGEFFYYKQQIQLRESPYYTSLQYFYRNSRQYKGLCIPQNFALTYRSSDMKQFLSNQKNKQQRQKSQEVREKKYFQEIDSDDDRNNSSRVLDSTSPEKKKIVKKQPNFQMKSYKNQKQQQQKINVKDTKIVNLENNKKPQQKKTVTFEQFFNFQPPLKSVNLPNNKLIQQNFNIMEPFEIPKKKQKKKSDDFTFFQEFMQPALKVEKPKNNGTGKRPSSNYLQLFGVVQKQKVTQKPKQKNGSLTISNSQKLIQLNLMDYQWLQKAPKPNIQPKRVQVNPELLNNILSGLKLKELKETITNNQQIIIYFNKLKLEKVIGSGSAGEVYFGWYQNENVAIKKVKAKQNPNALKQFERQLLTYIKMKRNSYLVSLIGLSKCDEDYYLLTEFCNSGSLFDLLHKRATNTPLSWKQRQEISIQIAKGMLALHEMNPPIIHRDLKSLNVFVIQNNNKFTAKVADFGLSRSPQAEMMTMYLGTLHWMAPQLLDNKQYSIKVDVYSYAVVLWQICSRKTPYNELSNPMAIVKHVTIQKKRPNMALIPPDCPPQFIELMCNCWAEDPNERPSFTEIIDKISKTHIFC